MKNRSWRRQQSKRSRAGGTRIGRGNEKKSILREQQIQKEVLEQENKKYKRSGVTKQTGEKETSNTGVRGKEQQSEVLEKEGSKHCSIIY